MLSRLLLVLISLPFWRKKPKQNVQDTTASASPETIQTVNESDASQSREILKVLTLEREILGTALTTIYESEAQGIITRAERDRLIDKYSADLKELESKISVHQHAVDLFDLESAREELLRSFRLKLYEIDKKLAELRPGFRPSPPSITGSEGERLAATLETSQPSVRPSVQPSDSTVGSDIKDSTIGADKKMEAIRQEVLKAMERLEQIESEG